MLIKFKIFRPCITTLAGSRTTVSAATNLNDWLAKNPKVEILNWQATPTGATGELYITIQ